MNHHNQKMILRMTILFIFTSLIQNVFAFTQVFQPFPKTSFMSPIFAQEYQGFIYVAEQGGRIMRFKKEAPEIPSLWFDLRGEAMKIGNEEGLLGFVIPKSFSESSPYFYAYYSKQNPKRTVLSLINQKTKKISYLLEIPQPYSNHNGGMIAFGPDGNLYIGVGDGGSSGDPRHNGQNRQNLLGAILRIKPKVSTASYSIPKDNPYAKLSDQFGYKKEIYAYGLRNPWRFSFDPQGKLWVADVGQNNFEEINIVEKGDNLGWRYYEGNSIFRKSNNPKKHKKRRYRFPIHTYPHSVGRSITGGYVYRGKACAKDLKGKYVFADFVTNKVFKIDPNNPEKRTIVARIPRVSSFFEDKEGELYIISHGGNIYSLRCSP